MAKWTIRNYSLFLSAVREKYDLTTIQARVMYSEMRRDLERPVFRSDLTKHPQVTKAALNFAVRAAFRKKEEDGIMKEIEDAIDEREDFEEFEGGIDYA